MKKIITSALIALLAFGIVTVVCTVKKSPIDSTTAAIIGAIIGGLVG